MRVLALAAAFGGLAPAHHFLVASYALDKVITVEGSLVRFLLRNPHSFIEVEAAGQGVRMVEWASAGQLGRAGVGGDTLKAGDHVVVRANPARNPAERKLRMVSIVRPADGWRWSEEDR